MLLSIIGPQVADSDFEGELPLIEQKFRDWLKSQKKLGKPNEDMIVLCLCRIDKHLTGEADDSLGLQAAEDDYFQAVYSTILDQSEMLQEQDTENFGVQAQKKREIAGKFIETDWKKLATREVNQEAYRSVIRNIRWWLEERKQRWRSGLRLLDLCINWVDDLLNREEYEGTEFQIAERVYFQAVYDMVWEQLIEPRYKELEQLICSTEVKKSILKFLSSNYWGKQASNGDRSCQPKDVYQEAYLALRRNRSSRKYIELGTGKAYFLNICEKVQMGISHGKGRMLELISDEVLTEYSKKRQDEESESIRRKKLKGCLDKLSPKHRELLMKTIVWEYSAQEIVEELLYKNPSVVSSTKKRIKEKLQKCLSSKR